MPDLTLNERAAALLNGKVLNDFDHGDGRIQFYPDEDMNAAVALWRAAPEEVKEAVANAIVERNFSIADHAGSSIFVRATIGLFTNSAALTKVIVEKWEEFNGK